MSSFHMCKKRRSEKKYLSSYITTFSSIDLTGRLLYRLLVCMRILAGTRKQLKKNAHKHAHTYVHTPVRTAITAS